MKFCINVDGINPFITYRSPCRRNDICSQQIRLHQLFWFRKDVSISQHLTIRLCYPIKLQIEFVSACMNACFRSIHASISYFSSAAMHLYNIYICHGYVYGLFFRVILREQLYGLIKHVLFPDCQGCKHFCLPSRQNC